MAALDAGADDYVTKPFDMGELLARLRAAVRRGTTEPEQAVVVTDAFTVDLAARQVTVDGVAVRLTPTEWALLSELVRAPGRLVGQRQLLQSVWGPAYETGDQLPAGLPGPAAAQARARPGAPAVPAHRTRHGLPLHALNRTLARASTGLSVPKARGFLYRARGFLYRKPGAGLQMSTPRAWSQATGSIRLPSMPPLCTSKCRCGPVD